MKKRILLLSTILVFTFLLGGCHGSKERAAFVIPEDFDTSKQYDISFWAKNDTNKSQTDIYEKTIRDFEQLYPNIKVTLRLYSDYVKMYNDVITNIATNTTPNVCITYPDHIATYQTGENTVVPLDGLMEDKRYGLGGSELRFDGPRQSEMIEKFLDECIIDGSHYAVPYMRSTEACYINKSFVEKLGYTVPDVLTWDYIWEVSEAAMATDADGNYIINGQNVLIPFIYKSTDNMMIQMLKQTKGAYSTSDGEILIFNDKTQEILETISAHAKTKAFSTFKISSYPANFLNAGQCIFAIDSTAGSTWMGSKAPLLDISEDKLVDFETVVRMIPQYDVENPKMISQGPSLCIFNKEDTQEVLASWLFMQYLLTNNVQISYSKTEGYLPVTTKALESDEYKQYLADEGIDGVEHYDIKLKTVKLLLENIDNTFITPVFNGSASLRDTAGQMIEEVTKAVRRKKEVNQDFFDKLYQDMISLYRLDNVVMEEDALLVENSDGDTAKGRGFASLPLASKVLLLSLIGAWVIIGAVFAIKSTKRDKF